MRRRYRLSKDEVKLAALIVCVSGAVGMVYLGQYSLAGWLVFLSFLITM